MKHKKGNLPAHDEFEQGGYSWKSLIVPLISLLVSIFAFIKAVTDNCNC